MLDTAAAGLVLTGEDKEIVDMVHDFVLKEVRPKAARYFRRTGLGCLQQGI